MRRGIILMNLGSPDSTSVQDVKKYLNEFLMDERVIDMSYLKRLLLVKGIIVPFRAPKSAKAYQSIWTKEGSPLIVLTLQLQGALQQQVAEPVSIAMRYGSPSPQNAFDELIQKHPELEEVVLVPLYPHFAMSSYETAAEYAKEIHQKGRYPFKLVIVPPFYDDADYLDAQAAVIDPFLKEEYDQIIFSYHGVPERHIHKDDITGNHCLKTPDCCNVSSRAHKQCYRHQCFETTRGIVKRLQIPEGKYSNTFQSRLGRDEWLKPYTAMRLAELPGEGIKKLVVVCPAFVSDCLETLEEIAEEGKEIFLHAGGEKFTMVPCMNSDSHWVRALKGLVEKAVKK